MTTGKPSLETGNIHKYIFHEAHPNGQEKTTLDSADIIKKDRDIRNRRIKLGPHRS
ncbi:hypothetical protein DSUL_60048 [Desulfovibrionales bacterium]